MFEITGKIALVTGGASGIGFKIAQELLKNGLKGVTIVDINEENGNTALQKIKNEYGDNKAIFVKTNIADRNQFHDAFKTTLNVFKNLDIVINCAAIVNEKDWEQGIATNLTGTVTGTLLAMETYLPQSKSGNDALVINVASLLGLNVNDCFPVYCATKSGIIGLTRSCGSKNNYEKTKVRVMALCPGATDTSFLSYKESSFSTKEHFKTASEGISKEFKQDASNVSKAAIQMIKEGENGSVWAAELNEPAYEIQFPSYKELKKI